MKHKEWSGLKKWLEREKRRVDMVSLTNYKLFTDGRFDLYWRPYMQAVLDKMEELENGCREQVDRA